MPQISLGKLMTAGIKAWAENKDAIDLAKNAIAAKKETPENPVFAIGLKAASLNGSVTHTGNGVQITQEMAAMKPKAVAKAIIEDLENNEHEVDCPMETQKKIESANPLVAARCFSATIKRERV